MMILWKNPYHLKAKNMKDRKITLSLATAKEWYNKGGELKEVALQAYSEDEMKPMALVRSWEDAFSDNGFVYHDSKVKIVSVITSHLGACPMTKHWFRTKAQAKSALAFAQLSHIVADANNRMSRIHDGYWHVVYQDEGRLSVLSNYTEPLLIGMKTHEMAKECISKHYQLWLDYFMIQTPDK